MSLLDSAISIIAPAECLGCGLEGASICNRCSKKYVAQYGERCGRCAVLSTGSKTCQNCRKLGLPGYIWICGNYDFMAKNVIIQYKFNHQRFIAESMASLMANTFKQFNQLNRQFVIVPVPSATTRVRERGFDHTLLLAKHMSKRLGLPMINPLGRLGQSLQVGAAKNKRFEQSENDYYLKIGFMAHGQKILLIDDVMTTGATLGACAKVLRAHGAASVAALVFAKKL